MRSSILHGAIFAVASMCLSPALAHPAESASSSSHSKDSSCQPNPGQQLKVDVHAHFLPPFYSQALRDEGYLPGPDGLPAIPAWTPELQLSFMKNNSIIKSILSISSPGTYLSPPSADATRKAIDLTRKTNEYAANLKAQYPSKFGYFAALPLPDVDAAIEEIDYVFTKLKPAPDGVVLLSNYYGLYYGDPKYDPVYEALSKHNAIIFEHPTNPCTEHNYAAYSINGTHAPITPLEWQSLNRPIAVRQYASATLDFPFDTARTFADLFYSTVPTRFPKLQWIIVHAGGAITDTIDRVIAYSVSYPNLGLTTDFMKKTLAKNFFFDLTGPWPVTSSIPTVLRWVDYTRIVWGSDSPFSPYVSATRVSVAYDSDVVTAFEGDQHAAKKIKAVSRGNAMKLLKHS